MGQPPFQPLLVKHQWRTVEGAGRGEALTPSGAFVRTIKG